MNILEINNLKALIALEYPHICINPEDLRHLLNMEWERRKFYPCTDKSKWDKIGFFNNGKTTCWTDYSMPSGHIKISDKNMPTSGKDKTWSDTWSFSEANSVIKIQKMMKMKAFW